ncbi:MAG: murein biosynthesis integral membrane protein MurJ [Actinobacteria bacterium]|nr:murein biosynthesis integral membrane protein MurJ [Actinomycetota bacterium]
MSVEPDKPVPSAGEPQAFARDAAVMAVGTAISRVTGFLRYAGLAYVLGLTLRYGSTNLPSTYNLANSMPNMIYDLVMGGIIASLFIPVFVEYLSTRSREEAWHVASSVTNISLVILAAVTALGIAASPLIIRLMTAFGSYSASDVSTQVVRDQASFLLRFFVPQIIFYGLSAIFGGLLNAHRHFTAPAFAPIANNLVVIGTVVVFHFLPGPRDNHLHLVVLAVGTTLGVVAQALVQLPMLFRIGVKYSFTFDLKHPAIRRIGRLAVPLLGYILLWQVGTWFVFALAIKVDGGVPSYQYAQMFFQLPYGVFAVSIITAIFPALSEHVALRRQQRFKETMNAGVRSTALIIVPCAVIYLLLNKPIIRFLLQHGFFKAGDTELLSGVLFFFSLGLIPYSIDMLLTKTFYSMQDTRTPMIINCFVVAINMGANLLFFRLMGVKGLALGFSVAYVFSMLIDGTVLRLRLGPLGGRRMAATAARLLAASGVMATVIYACLRLVDRLFPYTGLARELLEMLLPMALGLVAFFAVAHALRMEELEALREMSLKWLGRVFRRGSRTEAPRKARAGCQNGEKATGAGAEKGEKS